MRKILVFISTLTILLFLNGCATTHPTPKPNVDDVFPPTQHTTGKKVFEFDPNYNLWAVYDEEGNRVKIGRASGGKDYCPEIGRPCRTPAGTFKILSKGDEDCKSSRYPIATSGGAYMGYCMHFHPKGYAIHGVTSLPDYNNSHGCIGVTVEDAQWLNQYFLEKGSKVVVRPYHHSNDETVVAKVDLPSSNRFIN